MMRENSRQPLDLFGEHYNVETSALHRKLQSKNEALKIMRKELEKFRTERDQFKLMAETLQLRFTAIRRNTDYSKMGFKGSEVAAMLNETREKNIKLTTEVESLKQKLNELQGDLKVLRQKNTLGDAESILITTAKATDLKDEQEWKIERSNFISQLESLKRKNAQLTFDIKINLDEKEEAVSDRDAYKCKSHRLNHELLVALKANESHPRILDVDGLILENKYLQEKLKNCESELEFAQQSANKYKSMLDAKRKKGIIKLGTNNIDSIISHKQVKNLLENESELPSKAETIADLKQLCLALLDNLNDKNLALTHQKKTNKMLATKIAELEQRIHLFSTDDDKNESEPTSFSPSQILLNGYCPSKVDCDIPTKSSNITEDSGTMSSDSHGQISDEEHDDSLSTGSNRSSIISSEYENPSNLSNLIMIHKTKLESNDVDIPNTVINERLNDLKDFPPELAALVQNALHALDLKDVEDAKQNASET